MVELQDVGYGIYRFQVFSTLELVFGMSSFKDLCHSISFDYLELVMLGQIRVQEYLRQ